MELKNSGAALNPDSFNELESSLGVKLPESYKEFMLEHNGGRPVEEVSFPFLEVYPQIGKTRPNHTIIGSFSTLEDIPMFYENLLGAEVIPEKYLSVADDVFGNEILMCLQSGSDYGKIFFGNHELYQEDDIHWVLSEISPSFEEFLKLME